MICSVCDKTVVEGHKASVMMPDGSMHGAICQTCWSDYKREITCSNTAQAVWDLIILAIQGEIS